MMIIITNNVQRRVRGLLASCMLEIAPGVYTSPKINPRVREQIWDVLQDFFVLIKIVRYR